MAYRAKAKGHKGGHWITVALILVQTTTAGILKCGPYYIKLASITNHDTDAVVHISQEKFAKTNDGITYDDQTLKSSTCTELFHPRKWWNMILE